MIIWFHIIINKWRIKCGQGRDPWVDYCSHLQQNSSITSPLRNYTWIKASVFIDTINGFLRRNACHLPGVDRNAGYTCVLSLGKYYLNLVAIFACCGLIQACDKKIQMYEDKCDWNYGTAVVVFGISVFLINEGYITLIKGVLFLLQ